jgi:hypothetical protein
MDVYAMALVVARTHDEDLKRLLLSTADFLVGTQKMVILGHTHLL